MNKLTKGNVVNGLHRAKNFIGNAYHTAKNILGNIDNGVRLFKTVYGAVSPMIDNYGGAGVTKKNVDNDLDSVRNKLAKKNIKFTFAAEIKYMRHIYKYTWTT